MSRKNIAFVTGASSGIGREFVMQISRQFQSIDEFWVVARRRDRLEELEKSVKQNVKIIQGDLSDDVCLDEIKNLLQVENPKIKFLINCAGFGKIGPFESGNYENQIGMIDLNCRALTAVTYLALPYMKENSRIIELASAASFLPQPNFAVYAASKSYVLSFSRALNAELKEQKIYVTAVCPGPVNTEFFDIAESEQERVWYKNLIMADCSKVVKKALKDSLECREKSIYGTLMNSLYVMAKVLPHRILIRMMKASNE